MPRPILNNPLQRWRTLDKDHEAGSDAALAEVSGTLSQYADQTIEAEPQLQRIAALVHYANGDRVRADKYLARYVEQRPNDIAMRRLHAEVLLALGEAKQAAALLAPLARQEPRNLDLLRSVGQAYLQSGQYSEAEAAFARLLTLAPADHAALTTLALARLGVGNVDGAQTGLAEAVADAEVGRGAPMLLTVLQLKAGDGERALATIEALLEKYGQDARVLNLLGVVRASLGDQTGARAGEQHRQHVGRVKAEPRDTRAGRFDEGGPGSAHRAVAHDVLPNRGALFS